LKKSSKRVDSDKKLVHNLVSSLIEQINETQQGSAKCGRLNSTVFVKTPVATAL